MNIYCPACGRPTPSDSKVCAYCGKLIPFHEKKFVPQESKKSDDKKIIMIIVIVIALIIIIPIVISAAVYFSVSNMMSSPSISLDENAIVLATSSDGNIQVRLISVGDNYGIGYDTFRIMVDNQLVGGLNSIGDWTIGEKINIGEGTSGNYEVNGNNLSAGNYDVVVIIIDTVIFDGTVEIT